MVHDQVRRCLVVHDQVRRFEFGRDLSGNVSDLQNTVLNLSLLPSKEVQLLCRSAQYSTAKLHWMCDANSRFLFCTVRLINSLQLFSDALGLRGNIMCKDEHLLQDL